MTALMLCARWLRVPFSVSCQSVVAIAFSVLGVCLLWHRVVFLSYRSVA